MYIVDIRNKGERMAGLVMPTEVRYVCHDCGKGFWVDKKKFMGLVGLGLFLKLGLKCPKCGSLKVAEDTRLCY